MKRLLITFAVLALIVLFGSCSKKSSDPDEEQDYNLVTINAIVRDTTGKAIEGATVTAHCRWASSVNTLFWFESDTDANGYTHFRIRANNTPGYDTVHVYAYVFNTDLRSDTVHVRPVRDNEVFNFLFTLKQF